MVTCGAEVEAEPGRTGFIVCDVGFVNREVLGGKDWKDAEKSPPYECNIVCLWPGGMLWPDSRFRPSSTSCRDC